MAVRLIRAYNSGMQIENHEDTRALRFGMCKNGVVANYKEECGYIIDNEDFIFTIKAGEIIVDGWQIEIDYDGVKIGINQPASGQMYIVFAELDLRDSSSQKISVKAEFSLDSGFKVDAGDDLTTSPNGVARLVLYEFKVIAGGAEDLYPFLIKDVKKCFNLVKPGYVFHAEMASDSSKINGLPLKGDKNDYNDTYLKLDERIFFEGKMLLYNSLLDEEKYIEGWGTLLSDMNNGLDRFDKSVEAIPLTEYLNDNDVIEIIAAIGMGISTPESEWENPYETLFGFKSYKIMLKNNKIIINDSSMLQDSNYVSKTDVIVRFTLRYDDMYDETSQGQPYLIFDDFSCYSKSGLTYELYGHHLFIYKIYKIIGE